MGTDREEKMVNFYDMVLAGLENAASAARLTANGFENPGGVELGAAVSAFAVDVEKP